MPRIAEGERVFRTIQKIVQPRLPPELIARRDDRAQAAIVLVHGFTAEPLSSWGALPDQLLADPALNGWDLYVVRYQSNLRIDVPLVSVDPDIEALALTLVTTVASGQLARYNVLSLIGHSMGGLIVMRASAEGAVAQRLSNHVLVGTPAAGVGSRTIGRLKSQVRDLAPSSPFLERTWTLWQQAHAQHNFSVLTIVGNADEVVGLDSTATPFGEVAENAVIDGNHAQIADGTNPDTARHISQFLCSSRLNLTAAESVDLALEERHYQDVVSKYGTTQDLLDPVSAVQLALAYDGLNRSDVAIELLSRYSEQHGSDILGTYAGRLKRRWLRTGSLVDFEASRNAYERALALAEQGGDPDDIYYPAVNLAFMAFLFTPNLAKKVEAARGYAELALDWAPRGRRAYWSAASRAEAQLLLGDIPESLKTYRECVRMKPENRNLVSTYTNAAGIAIAMEDRQLSSELLEIFGFGRIEHSGAGELLVLE
jgi:tetratricopeptide (TPR) repeat protein